MPSGAITMPCPPSPSITQVALLSRAMRHFGVGLYSPLARLRRYTRSMLLTPCVSMPRRSAYSSTSAVWRASASGMPTASSSRSVVQRIACSGTRTSISLGI